jgi:pyruvate-formate lyase-activating enzyme
MVPKEVIEEWAKKKTYIKNRLARIRKRLKKLQKQEKHFEMRLKLINQYDKEHDNA